MTKWERIDSFDKSWEPLSFSLSFLKKKACSLKRRLTRACHVKCDESIISPCVGLHHATLACYWRHVLSISSRPTGIAAEAIQRRQSLIPDGLAQLWTGCKSLFVLWAVARSPVLLPPSSRKQLCDKYSIPKEPWLTLCRAGWFSFALRHTRIGSPSLLFSSLEAHFYRRHFGQVRPEGKHQTPILGGQAVRCGFCHSNMLRAVENFYFWRPRL